MQNENIITLDIKKLFHIFWSEKWKIILITTLFGILGLIYGFSLREEFVSTGKILPEAQGNGSKFGDFSGLAALAGVDLSSIGANGVDAVRPDLYPEVINSTPFYLELLKAKIETRDNTVLTFEQFYHNVIEEGEKPEAKLLIKYPIKTEGILVINRLNEIRLKELKERINSSIDKRTGIISISAKMPDPVVSAEVTKFGMEYLMEYIKKYRTEKLRKDVDYLRFQVDNSRGKYYSNQQKRATYSDQFQAASIKLQTADIQRERIESEYRLSSSFYNELLKKYEEAKFRLHQETPVFKVLEPAVTPVKKSEPKKAIIVILFLILGGFLSLLFVLLKNII